MKIHTKLKKRAILFLVFLCSLLFSTVLSYSFAPPHTQLALGDDICTISGNIITGTDGNDVCSVPDGDSNLTDYTILGLGGNDTLTGGSGQDNLDGGNDNDQLIAGANNDVLFGGDGNDTLLGGTGNDTVVGGNGEDILAGFGGSSGNNPEIDTLIGGGNVTFDDQGNASVDSFGHGAKDIFVLGNNSNVFYANAGSDDYAKIVGFDKNVDQLRLTPNRNYTFVTGSVFTDLDTLIFLKPTEGDSTTDGELIGIVVGVNTVPITSDPVISNTDQQEG